jgi:hypothetical protein
MSLRFVYAIALLASSALACRPLAAPSAPAPAAQLDWSADDSNRVAWLERHGRVVRGRHAIVIAPADSITDAGQRALADSLDRGVAAIERLMGAPYTWQRIGERPVKVYVSPDRFISHASGQDVVFVSLARVRNGTAPFLHETSHELLSPTAPFAPWEYADTLVGKQIAERWPLWLTEGLPDYLAQTVAAQERLHEGDVFAIGGLTAVDSVCAARARINPRRAEWLHMIGAAGRPQGLFTTDRATVAPAFYACAQSMTKFLVDRVGLKEVVALFPAIKAGRFETELARVAGMPVAELRRRWLEKLRLKEP